MSDPVVADRSRLHQDLLAHLCELRPGVAAAYPAPYLAWLVDDSITLATPFGLADVAALRVFLLLRFDVAPGFFKEPRIARLLGDASLPPMERWQRLAGPEWGDAWLAARRFEGAVQWRANLWGAAA